MAPRQRKPRTSRMDAAIDAMVPFGFTEDIVKAKMHHLLKEISRARKQIFAEKIKAFSEYGGIDGYGFIELDGYRVLLEGLLDDQDKRLHMNNQQQAADTSNANDMVEAERVEESHAFAPTPGFTDIPVCSSTPLNIPLPPPPPPPVTFPPPSPAVLDAVLPPPPPPPVVDAALPSPEIGQSHRRKPCHGWISDADEEWHFITLPSSSSKQPISPPQTPPPQLAQPDLSGGIKKRPKRRSRWDLMPEDMLM